MREHPVFAGVSARVRFGVHNNTLRNGARALMERVFLSPAEGGALQPPPPCTANVAERLKRFRAGLMQRAGGARPVSREQFLDFYSGRRRQCYERAVRSLEESPITERDFGVKKAFVKAEKINFDSKPDPPPRVIQPRDPRYNVEVGVYLRPLEHQLYRGIADMLGGPTVMKGYSAEGVADQLRQMWEQFADPVAVGLDASRFDQHVRPEMLEWEHSVYVGCFAQDARAKLKWLLKGQIDNKCYLRATDGTIRYKVRGSRMSGDMNTASGNCLIMCALVDQLCRERRVRFRLANNGDDCVVVMERRDCSRFMGGLEDWFLEFGFKMKVEAPVDVFERIEFCQAHPIYDGQRWIMVRNPNTTLAKDACCVVRDYGWGKAAKDWLKAVGDCGLAMTGGIPVAQEHYAAMLRNGSADGPRRPIASVQETGMAMLSKGCSRGYSEVTEAARISFFDAWGVLPSHQEAYEAQLRDVRFTVPDSPCIGIIGASYGTLPPL
nr:MAG: RNA-dependent RNA polymerase [flactilig virus 18]